MRPPPHLIETVAGQLATHVGPDQDALLLFGANGGRHLAAFSFDRWYYPARQAANRPELRFHELSHFGAVLAAPTGASLAELMDASDTAPQAALRYQHVAQGRDREIAALLSKLADSR